MYQKHMVSMYCTWSGGPLDRNDQEGTKGIDSGVPLLLAPPARKTHTEAKEKARSLPILKPLEDLGLVSNPKQQDIPKKHRRAHSLTLARINSLRVIIPEKKTIRSAFVGHRKGPSVDSESSGSGGAATTHSRGCNNRVVYRRRKRRESFQLSPRQGRRDAVDSSTSNTPLRAWKPSHVAKWARKLAPHSLKTILDKKICGRHLCEVEDEQDLEDLGISKADSLTKILREIQRLQTEDAIWRFDVAIRLARSYSTPRGRRGKVLQGSAWGCRERRVLS